MNDDFLPIDQFEILRDHGAFLVRRNNALVAEVLMIKERERRNLDQFIPTASVA